MQTEQEFDKVTQRRKQGPLFSFYVKGLEDGDVIAFADDSTVTATIVSEREVDYKGDRFKLSPLTRKIFEQKGTKNKSGAYQGAAHWTYNGVRLKNMPDMNGQGQPNS